MAGVSDSFHERTNEALVATLVPRPDNLPLIVLVVEDSEDDELTSIIAEASAVPSPDYSGGWGAMVKGSAEGFQLTVKFLLIGEEWERQWTLPDISKEILSAIMGGTHNVAILPRELAGDLEQPLELPRIAGALIIEAAASDAVKKASLPFLGG